MLAVFKRGEASAIPSLALGRMAIEALPDFFEAMVSQTHYSSHGSKVIVFDKQPYYARNFSPDYVLMGSGNSSLLIQRQDFFAFVAGMATFVLKKQSDLAQLGDINLRWRARIAALLIKLEALTEKDKTSLVSH